MAKEFLRSVVKKKKTDRDQILVTFCLSLIKERCLVVRQEGDRDANREQNGMQLTFSSSHCNYKSSQRQADK